MVRVRTETDDDVDAVAAVHVRAWQAGYAGLMPAEVLASLDPAARAAERRRRRAVGGPFTTMVAEVDAVVVGFATVGPYRIGRDRDRLDPAYGEILAVYVEPAQWGNGIGSALLSDAAVHLRERGFTEARLWVLEDNVRARRFYERAGLFPDGERSVFALRRATGQPPVEIPEVRYTWRLDL